MQVKIPVEKLLTKSEAKQLLEKAPNISQKIKNRILNFCSNCFPIDRIELIKNQLLLFGLKEFEIINIIDTKPTGLVHLQNIIEEMTERLDEDQMESILNTININKD